MRDFFLGHVKLELQQNTESLQIYQSLSKIFPNSNYILSQTAIANYNIRGTIPKHHRHHSSSENGAEFDLAEKLFEELRNKDPYRLDGMDIYSNILYVKESPSNLSYLAHTAQSTDKYRPETCCIIGMYTLVHQLQHNHTYLHAYHITCR